MTNHTGALISDGCPNGEQFLCVSGPEEEDGEEETGEEVENGPEVTITWTPPPTLPPDQHMPTVHSELSTTRSLGDSILDAMEQMRGVPGSTPFSTGCTKHVTGVVSATDHLQPAPHACMHASHVGTGSFGAAFQLTAFADCCHVLHHSSECLPHMGLLNVCLSLSVYLTEQQQRRGRK